MLDHLPALLRQVKREAIGVPAVDELTVEQVMKTLILDAFREPCLICDGEPNTVEVYPVPKELQKAYQSVIFYTLCRSCKRDFSTRGKVADKLAGQLKAENARLGVL